MQITYIGHSGFMAECDDCTFIFDYYEGLIPAVNKGKPLFVFVSHSHPDHFNPEIFSIQGPKEIHYILAHEIRSHMKPFLSLENLHFMRGEEQLMLKAATSEAAFSVQTLRSTDCGVAFLICYRGKYIYHAGDLHWWVWRGESRQYNNNMTANFKKYTEPLKGLNLFAAFVPLDPRQEDWYDKGMLHILETACVNYAFPMHFWKDYSVINRFLSSPQGEKYKKHIIQIEREGQTFVCNENQEVEV